MKRSVVLAWVLGLCLATALAGVAYLLRTTSQQSARIEQLSREAAEWRVRAERAPAVPGARDTAAVRPGAQATERPAAPRPVLPDQAQAIERLNAKLAEANAAISQAETRLEELRLEGQRLAVDNKRLAASEADLNENLAAANRLVDAQARELKTKGERLVQLEVANKQLRDQTNADSAKLSRMTRVSSELQDIHRRREALLNSVLRRYREVTDQYRVLAGAIESRDRTEGPAVAGTDVSRIENAISMAEEDLRQIGALSAQAMRLEKQIAGSKQP